jgi:hypothetical protein
MSGMLQHNDAYRERAQSRQAEARRWAEVDQLARLSKANRVKQTGREHHQRHHHTMRMWLRAWRMHLHELHSPRHLRPHH